MTVVCEFPWFIAVILCVPGSSQEETARSDCISRPAQFEALGVLLPSVAVCCTASTLSHSAEWHGSRAAVQVSYRQRATTWPQRWSQRGSASPGRRRGGKKCFWSPLPGYDEIRSELWSRMLVFLFPSLSLSPKRRRAAATDAYQERHDMELWIDLGWAFCKFIIYFYNSKHFIIGYIGYWTPYFRYF